MIPFDCEAFNAADALDDAGIIKLLEGTGTDSSPRVQNSELSRSAYDRVISRMVLSRIVSSSCSEVIPSYPTYKLQDA